MFLPMFLLSPGLGKQIRDQQKRERDELISRLRSTPIQDWSDKIKWSPLMHISAASYRPFIEPLFDIAPTKLEAPKENAVRFGPWGYQNFILPKGEPLFTNQGTRRGDVIFDDDVVIPKLWKERTDNVWMSLTPMEMLTQRPGMRLARGHVLIGGLGMGWALKEIVKLKRVSRVTVAEASKDIVEWFGKDLVAKVAASSGKEVALIHDDAYAVAHNAFDAFDAFIFDIWSGYGGARHDFQWKTLKRRAESENKRAWAWGASGAPAMEDVW